MNCSKIQSSCYKYTLPSIRYINYTIFVYPVLAVCKLLCQPLAMYSQPVLCPLHDYGVHCIQIDLQHFVVHVTNHDVASNILFIFGWFFVCGISRSVLNGHMFVYTELILDDILVYLQTITNYNADQEECAWICRCAVWWRRWLSVYNFYFK